jgi:hypothetical protein
MNPNAKSGSPSIPIKLSEDNGMRGMQNLILD